MVDPKRGGSIITLPVLVYDARVPPAQAVGMSLAIVGGTTLAASVLNARAGLVHVKAALLFSAAGMVGAFGCRPSSSLSASFALAAVVGASVILLDPIFQGLAIALMAGEIASLLISRMAVPVLYYMANETHRRPRLSRTDKATRSQPTNIHAHSR